IYLLIPTTLSAPKNAIITILKMLFFNMFRRSSSYNLPSYYIRNNSSIRQFYYTTIFNKMLKVTILIRVEINVILETRSGSVSNSIAYIVVVAAVGIAEIIMSTAAIIGSTSTIETNI